MIIDCHTHLGRNDHIRASVKELLSSMDDAKIDKALVFAGELNDYPTDVMLEEIRPYRDRLSGVASFNFDLRGVQLENHITSLHDMYLLGEIVAVKFYTGYYHKLPTELGHVLSVLEQVSCPVIFHCGDCLNSVKCAKLKYAHPLNIDEVAVDYPGMKFVIAHMGYPWHRDAAEVCYKNDNVYTDISGFVYNSFTAESSEHFTKVISEVIEVAGGTDKILFGSDWPISNQKSYVHMLHGLAIDNKKNIFSENAKKVFSI